VGKSFVFFWIVIGPVLYRTYYLKEEILDESLDNDVPVHQIEDKAVTLLKSIKDKTYADQE
jgi:hypothetical protein